MTRVVKSSPARVEFMLRVWDQDKGRHVDLRGWVARDTRLASPGAAIPFNDEAGNHAGWLAANIGSSGPGNPPRHTLHRDLRKLLKVAA